MPCSVCKDSEGYLMPELRKCWSWETYCEIDRRWSLRPWSSTDDSLSTIPSKTQSALHIHRRQRNNHSPTLPLLRTRSLNIHTSRKQQRRKLTCGMNKAIPDMQNVEIPTSGSGTVVEVFYGSIGHCAKRIHAHGPVLQWMAWWMGPYDFFVLFPFAVEPSGYCNRFESTRWVAGSRQGGRQDLVRVHFLVRRPDSMYLIGSVERIH